jgi:acyl-CoA thioesterase I
MPDRSNRSFPLASYSRARRRIISTQTDSVDEPAPDIVSVDSMPNSIAPDDSTVPQDAPPQISIASEPETSFAIGTAGFASTANDTCDSIPVHQPELDRACNFGVFKELLVGVKPLTWVFTGDSITQGAQFTGGARSYVEHFSERTRWELHRYHDAIVNTAAPGDTTRTLLDDFEWRALRFMPDVVSVMIGVNDAAGGRTRRSEFRDNLKFIIECARSEGALVLLHTPPHIDLDRAVGHADLRTYVRLIRDVARDLDVACIDHWAHWKRYQEGETGEAVKSWLAADGLHPTADGHRAMARLLFKRFGLLDEKSALCALLEK